MNAGLSILTYNFTYENPGFYDVVVSAYNYVSNVTKSQAVGVYEAIVDVDISGNSTIRVPPGLGTWRISAGPDQAPLDDIVCVWNMGSNYADTSYSVAMLNESTPHEVEFTYDRADTGTSQTISVNCSNAVSSQNFTMDVEVIWDNVTLGQLDCDNSRLWIPAPRRQSLSTVPTPCPARISRWTSRLSGTTSPLVSWPVITQHCGIIR